MRVAATFLIVVTAFIAVSLLPVQQAENPPFALPAFQRTFSVDSSAASRQVDLWGSDPLVWRVEPYYDDRGDRRIVQYFERGRMETRPGTSRVLHGALASELISGQIDLGVGASISQQPPQISIDSLELDDQVPTYLTLSHLAADSATDRSGAGRRIVDWIDRGGEFQRETTPAVVRYESYVPETGHNLPDVTVDLFERAEFADERWVEDFGYPISEPYWTQLRRDGEFAPSLVQVFERRILVYSPLLNSSERFTVASTGRHYYQWRYGTDINQSVPITSSGDVASEITMTEGLVATRYAGDFGTPLDLALSPSGHLLILTQDGRILRSDARDPNANPGELVVWADGIVNPRGMVSAGTRVLVTTEEGVESLRQRDGVGVRDEPVKYRSDLDTADVTGDDPIIDSEDQLVAVTGNPPGLVPLVRSDLSLRELNAGEGINSAGAVELVGGELYLAGQHTDGRARVVRLPSGEGNAALESPSVLATFPPGTLAAALAVADIDRWPITETGHVFAAVEDEEGARIYAIPETRADSGGEALEIGRGLHRPVAMSFGLDGSLYVADSELGVIRISPGQ